MYKSLYKTFVVFLFISAATFFSYGFSQNACGPDSDILGFIPGDWLVPDGPVPFLSFFGEFATFEAACNAHDICYGNPQQTQTYCDDQMLATTLAACEADFTGAMKSYCQEVAHFYYQGVSTFGEMSKAGLVSGVISQVTAKRIADWFGDDEFEACVNFRNNGVVNTEFDVVLNNANNEHIDTEPDSYEVNLKVGESSTVCVGTQGIWASISDLGANYIIQLRVDDYHTGFREVDRYVGLTP